MIQVAYNYLEFYAFHVLNHFQFTFQIKSEKILFAMKKWIFFSLFKMHLSEILKWNSYCTNSELNL